MHDRKAMNCSALLLGIERNQRYKFLSFGTAIYGCAFSLERRTFGNLKSRISWLTRIVLFSLCFLIMSVPAYAAGEGNVDGGAASVSA